jgi:hypothetical protein
VGARPDLGHVVRIDEVRRFGAGARKILRSHLHRVASMYFAEVVRGEAMNRGPGRMAGGMRKDEDNFHREGDQWGLPR